MNSIKDRADLIQQQAARLGKKVYNDVATAAKETAP